MLAGTSQDGNGLGAGLKGRGMEGGAGPRAGQREETWVYRFPKNGIGSLSIPGLRRAADRGGVSLAVQPACAGWIAHPSRTDPDGGELERHLAGLSGHAESERISHQNGSALQHPLEREFHRPLL